MTRRSPAAPSLFSEPTPVATANTVGSGPQKASWVNAHCDGGARGNPGPAGYGAVIQDDQGNLLAELSEFLGIRTNNFAEYSGLLACLQRCVLGTNSADRQTGNFRCIVMSWFPSQAPKPGRHRHHRG